MRFTLHLVRSPHAPPAGGSGGGGVSEHVSQQTVVTVLRLELLLSLLCLLARSRSLSLSLGRFFVRLYPLYSLNVWSESLPLQSFELL